MFIGGRLSLSNLVVRLGHLNHIGKASYRNIATMPFSQEKFDEIQRAIRLALVSTALNDWKRNFLRDMQAKLDRYGPRTSLSDKQYRQLMRLTRKYGEPKQQDVPRSRTPESHGFARRRSEKSVWRPSFRLVLAAMALGFIVIYKGAERFPEYLGPVVAVSSSQEIVRRVNIAD